MSRAQLAAGHAREYETIYILRPNIEKDVADDVAKRVADAITGHEGKLTEAELWGSRRLSYPIKKHFRGTYVYVKYLSRGEAVAELERQLRLVDAVIRHQTIQLRDNVKLADVKIDDKDLALDFDLPYEPDEPELPIEKELGLDAPMPERRRRRDDRHEPEPEAAPADAGDGAAKPAGDAKADAKPEAAKADAAKPEAAKAEAAKPEAAKPEAAKPEAAEDKKEGE